MDSAYAVLQRRRSRREERVLWIDQLCIDQNNVIERASQVRLMSKLYKAADRVVAWLGHSDSAHELQSFFAELQYKQEGLGLSGEQLKDATGGGEGPQWKAPCEFLQNDWFTRIWIIQEAAFSRELHLLYGDVCLDWDLVGEGIAVLWQWDMLKSMPALDGSYFSSPRTRVFTGFRNADTMLEFRGDVDYGRILSVLTALENRVGFRCSDQRDKIYALTNIFDDSRITPDYGIPTSTLFTQTMRNILRRVYSLDVMSWAGTTR
ncbi:heterokaryon incompatibility protein-domain-containing protein [Chaetomidium leptoderma]|uniref:Heterokaryon incompatibility protein-domain-containing protein n=1 Tax=Chaetomidium leptoderma TaxID=669021 RepID=A0AAN6ZRY4_9PEZI|nr:heterokaryon incompatibility protein-domain-containing protein [Chaetomidium leptoderma]